MKRRYIVLSVVAKNDTDKAFLCSGKWDDEQWVFADLWIPLSQIHDDYLHEIEEACEGDAIEIAVSEWWLNQQL